MSGSKVLSWLCLIFAVITLVAGIWMVILENAPIEAVILMLAVSGNFIALSRAEEAMIKPNFEIQVDSEGVQYFLDKNFKKINMVSSEETVNRLLDKGWILMGYDDIQKTFVLGKTKERIENEEALSTVNDYVVDEDEGEG